jgi:hypothetical protein
MIQTDLMQEKMAIKIDPVLYDYSYENIVPSKDYDVQEIRSNITSNFRSSIITLSKLKLDNEMIKQISKIIVDVEQICFDMYNTDLEIYIVVCYKITLALQHRYGKYLNKWLILEVINKNITLDQLVTPEVYEFYDNVDNRDTVKALLFNILIHQTDKQNCINIVDKVENSCFNYCINYCTDSAESYIRHWGCDMFKNIYSNRTGIIVRHLDPDSEICKKYGSKLLKLLLTDKIDPQIIGGMDVTELCPQANQEVREIIAQRTDQKIKEKTSTMFKCPSCGAFKCTYIVVQLRSVDEAPTTVCRCQICKKGFNAN